MTTTGSEPHDAGELPQRPVVDLPEAVRQRVIGWAAAALGAAEPADVPPALRRFARFAPAKRARLAATALGQAVQADAGFRALVAEYAARQAPDTSGAQDGSGPPGLNDQPLGTAGVDQGGPVRPAPDLPPAHPPPADPPPAHPPPTHPPPADLPPADVSLVAGQPPIHPTRPDLPTGERLDPATNEQSGTAVAQHSMGRQPQMKESAHQESAHQESAHQESLPVPPSTDPVTAAALAFLLRLPDADRLIQEATQAALHTDARVRVRQLEGELRVLTAKLARTAAELQLQLAKPDRAPTNGEEADRLRQRLRDQGSRIRDLQQQVDSGAARTDELIAAANAERDGARADAELWRQRAESATARAESANQGLQRLRDAAGDRRAASDRRIELLLGALEGAAFGLRRELDVLGGGPAPADVVAAGLPRPASDAERTTDPARLTAWAGLPGAHLIVDGYNVSKTGFPELSLSDQRDRLVRSLAAVAARTGAEVTVVFDGAAVATARPPARGIRVLFSPPGVLADDVIRDLVRAEPQGRVVIVVSSDRQVADRAAADGARTAASTVLLGLIGG